MHHTERNAARQTQRSIGNECPSGVPKRNAAVDVIEALRSTQYSTRYCTTKSLRNHSVHSELE